MTSVRKPWWTRVAMAACATIAAALSAAAWAQAPAEQAQGAQPPAAAAPAPALGAGEGDVWKGRIDLPGGNELEFHVRLRAATAEAPAAGVISIPVQGVKEAPLSAVVYDGAHLRFTLALPGAPEAAWPAFAAERGASPTAATGRLLQAGLEFPLSMWRPEEGESLGPNRPQTPVPPFPYSEREVVFVNPADGGEFAGTLTVPEGPGPHPAAILITGSGPQDRDETLFEHKPFLVIADHLTRAGVAVLRVDDRGAGKTKASPAEATIETHAGDVSAALDFLRKQPEIDPARIGLIGHSEGGVIGPLVAAQRPDDVAYLVMLAGTGRSGREVLIGQIAENTRAMGGAPEAVERARAAATRACDAVKAGDDAALRAALRQIVAAQAGEAPEGMGAEAAAALDAAAGEMARAFTSPWFRHFLEHDPREALRRVRAPVLVLNGSLDVQVIAADNVPEIEAALREGGNQRVTVRVLEGLNHLFQTAGTGAGTEYAQIEETFAPAALNVMTAWVRSTVGAGE